MQTSHCQKDILIELLLQYCWSHQKQDGLSLEFELDAKNRPASLWANRAKFKLEDRPVLVSFDGDDSPTEGLESSQDTKRIRDKQVFEWKRCVIPLQVSRALQGPWSSWKLWEKRFHKSLESSRRRCCDIPFLSLLHLCWEVERASGNLNNAIEKRKDLRRRKASSCIREWWWVVWGTMHSFSALPQEGGNKALWGSEIILQESPLQRSTSALKQEWHQDHLLIFKFIKERLGILCSPVTLMTLDQWFSTLIGYKWQSRRKCTWDHLSLGHRSRQLSAKDDQNVLPKAFLYLQKAKTTRYGQKMLVIVRLDCCLFGECPTCSGRGKLILTLIQELVLLLLVLFGWSLALPTLDSGQRLKQSRRSYIIEAILGLAVCMLTEHIKLLRQKPKPMAKKDLIMCLILHSLQSRWTRGNHGHEN
jgi:hypothetical protein